MVDSGLTPWNQHVQEHSGIGPSIFLEWVGPQKLMEVSGSSQTVGRITLEPSELNQARSAMLGLIRHPLSQQFKL